MGICHVNVAKHGKVCAVEVLARMMKMLLYNINKSQKN